MERSGGWGLGAGPRDDGAADEDGDLAQGPRDDGADAAGEDWWPAAGESGSTTGGCSVRRRGRRPPRLG
jgi:hypothetical protein